MDQHALTAIETLKRLFTSAPILRQPDPTLPFVLEVDASEVGVGAVLSQWVGTPPKLHPCGFFSKKLSPAALFFTRFNFTITYLPIKKNVKADSLSRLFDSPSSKPAPKSILPPSCFVGPIQWEVQSKRL